MYALLAGLNIMVVAMFVMILQPIPQAPVLAFVPGAAQRVVAPLEVRRQAVQGVPVRVVVPSVAIDLIVKPGSYEPERRQWTLDDSSAFFADRTVPANDNNGTTLLYGHATDAVFRRITQIQSDATATVHTDTGATFRYSFTSSQQISPQDTSILTSAGPPILALQTCSGPFDAYRTVARFSFEGVRYD